MESGAVAALRMLADVTADAKVVTALEAQVLGVDDLRTLCTLLGPWADEEASWARSVEAPWVAVRERARLAELVASLLEDRQHDDLVASWQKALAAVAFLVRFDSDDEPVRDRLHSLTRDARVLDAVRRTLSCVDVAQGIRAGVAFHGLPALLVADGSESSVEVLRRVLASTARMPSELAWLADLRAFGSSDLAKGFVAEVDGAVDAALEASEPTQLARRLQLTRRRDFFCKVHVRARAVDMMFELTLSSQGAEETGVPALSSHLRPRSGALTLRPVWFPFSVELWSDPPPMRLVRRFPVAGVGLPCATDALPSYVASLQRELGIDWDFSTLKGSRLSDPERERLASWLAGRPVALTRHDDAPPAPQRVEHATFGAGTVIGQPGHGKILVRFDDGTERVVLERFVRHVQHTGA